VKEDSNDYVIRVLDSPHAVPAPAWNALLRTAGETSPFVRHEYFAALHDSGSAVPATGWTPSFVTLWRGNELQAACPLYLKDHSYGEYVFDWAWANAYEQHGVAYYPKALVAVPFTPVPGVRLLAADAQARRALLAAVLQWCGKEELSSLHLLFLHDDEVAACAEAGLMLRNTVQFHWTNRAPTLVASRTALPPEGARSALGRPGGGTPGYADFDAFLASLSHDRRKKIRQERRKVSEAGVTFRWARGTDISGADWDFFYRCYARTYREHGNAPYLTPEFFSRVAHELAGHWLLFVAERGGRPIASSLIALGGDAAYGRYWGAVERVDCLHFEACYYQPIQWCIAHGVQRFEGGAQGEHKMARALMPVKTSSAHWLAHPAFAAAVERFLEREGHGIDSYLEHLETRTPFRHTAG
jgi:predicted N-acyltransferase